MRSLENLKILAHRGASKSAPENTLAAFQLALQQSADGIECDVRLSADGEPMVIHDITVDRTTPGSGRVDSLTVRQLERLDAGRWFSPAFEGQRIPRLDQLLDQLPTGLKVRVEIKHDSVRSIFKVVRAVSSVIANHQHKHQIGISSFHPGILLARRWMSPELPAARLFSANARYFLGRTHRGSRLLGVSGIDVPVLETLGSASDAAAWQTRFLRWRAQGWELTGWTVDDPKWRQPMCDAGFSTVITNVPGAWIPDIKNACNS